MAAKLPSGLGSYGVSRVISILGFGTTNRSLLSADSLGIEPGIRVGMVQTLIVTHDLKYIGHHNGSAPEVIPVPSLHLAKGLPYDIDVEFTIMPPAVLSYVEKYGASFGWTFLAERNFPVALSVRPHFSYARLFSGDTTLWNYGVNVSVSKDYVWWEPYAHIGYAMAQGCIRRELVDSSADNCTIEPAGVAGIGIKFNLALTFVAQIDTHNLEPGISLFIGKDF